MKVSVNTQNDIGLHDAVEHKFGEFTQKDHPAVLHECVAECHGCCQPSVDCFSDNVFATITLPDKPMALTIQPNLHHALKLYPYKTYP
ncbi:Uncharacterised protein [Escherichia coli]|nr:Uncharacterised protein [Escherichia coli]SQM12255.1 Uncharacterised protein [Escherichia coli]SQM26928.1 Uncharacterised protein [Escherichia coli]SQS28756.1 Uncharacterised protein [Escherichia coli]SQY60985.1 Uncharacterised protein [Escherichia coli]